MTASLMQLSPSTLRQHVLTFAVRTERAIGIKAKNQGRLNVFTAEGAGFAKLGRNDYFAGHENDYRGQQ